ncbi:MAG: hypothetical protein ACI4VM_03515 [Anaerovoracaceae bacterium]
MHFLEKVMSFLFSEAKLMHGQFAEMDKNGVLERFGTDLDEKWLLYEWNSSPI